MAGTSVSIVIADEEIEEIDVEDRGNIYPRMSIRLQCGSYVFFYATEKQFQQIAQAIDDWRDSDAAGSPDERAS